MLKFNTSTGAFTASSLLAGSAGLPPAVGISTYAANSPAWAGIPSPGLNTDIIQTQLAMARSILSG
jgi:hypothetical protein